MSIAQRLLWIAGGLGLTICAWCQSATTGGLAGTVTDPARAVLPKVTLSLIHSATGQRQTTITGANGTYTFSLVPPGAYAVEFAAHGFKTAQISAVIVNISEAPTLDATLEPGETAAPVACQCRINVATSSTSTVMDAKAITAV